MEEWLVRRGWAPGLLEGGIDEMVQRESERSAGGKKKEKMVERNKSVNL